MRKISYRSYRSYLQYCMSRRMLGKLSFHMPFWCQSSFRGCKLPAGVFAVLVGEQLREREQPVPADAVSAARFRTLLGAKLPTLYAADPQPWACPAWCWLKLNIQLCGFLRLFFGKDKNGLCFLPQVQIVISLVNGGARENDTSQEFQEL